MADISWFRAPSGDDPGTLNACYHALDLPVIRGRADEVALDLGDGPRTYAWLLTEVAACGGVLRAFGVDVGDRVVLGALPLESGVVAALAVARVGGVAVHDDTPGAEGRVVVRELDGGAVFGIDGEEVAWDVAMRAGRTDPAGCADVSGDAALARHGDDELTVLEAVGGAGDPVAPRGARLVEVGGARVWSFAPSP